MAVSRGRCKGTSARKSGSRSRTCASAVLVCVRSRQHSVGRRRRSAVSRRGTPRLVKPTGRTPPRSSAVLQGTASRNALTALLRTIDLGIDARRSLTDSQITSIAAWRHRPSDDVDRTIARAEAVRLARDVIDLTGKLETNHDALRQYVFALAPSVLDIAGAGPVSAAVFLCRAGRGPAQDSAGAADFRRCAYRRASLLPSSRLHRLPRRLQLRRVVARRACPVGDRLSRQHELLLEDAAATGPRQPSESPPWCRPRLLRAATPRLLRSRPASPLVRGVWTTQPSPAGQGLGGSPSKRSPAQHS